MRAAIDEATRSLEAGNGVAIFPELSAEQREQGMTDFWGVGVYFEKRPKND
jgi:hypothetical protein